MTHGIPTGTAGLESGGDGGLKTIMPPPCSRSQRQGEFFNRFSYDITPDMNAYIQGSWAESGDYSTWAPLTVSSSSSPANTFFTNNPISRPRASALTAAATAAGNFVKPPVPFSTNPSCGPAAPDRAGWLRPIRPSSPTASYVPQIVNGQNADSQGDVYLTKGVDRNLS